jgi:hypothetical protein
MEKNLKKNMTKENLFDVSDTSDLPIEIVKQLNCKKEDKPKKCRLTQLIKEADRPISLDELLVANYRKYGNKINRKSLQAKMYIKVLNENWPIWQNGKRKGRKMPVYYYGEKNE